MLYASCEVMKRLQCECRYYHMCDSKDYTKYNTEKATIVIFCREYFKIYL